MSLRAVGEDCNGRENVTDGELASGEDCSGRNGELPAATFAAPHLAARQIVKLYRAALWAEGVTAVCRKPDRLEGVIRLLIRQAHHLRQTERPGLFREKEMLTHSVLNPLRLYRI